MLKVLVVEPGKQPYVKRIDGSLNSMQAVVGGFIQAIYPWQDEVALVCNDEGKLNGLPLNRFLLDDDGDLMDVIAGPFFLCLAPLDSDSFENLPDDMIDKYRRMFWL